jgi:hypothetical protein
MTVNLSLGKNWKTTLGGAIFAAAGFAYALPALLTSDNIILPPKWQHIIVLIAAIGGAIMGFGAKDSTTHSTQAEVSASTTASTTKTEVTK